MPFPIGAPIESESLSLAVFEITGLKDIGVTTFTFQGHVTSSTTSLFHLLVGNRHQASISNRFRDVCILI